MHINLIREILMSDSSVYINPLTDFGFKYLFGQIEHKEFFISLVNALLDDDQQISDVEFVDKEHIRENKDSRAIIYDVHCLTTDGKKIIVEMQNRYQSKFRDRAVFYLAADIYRQGKKGNDWDYSLTPVYGIFMMNFDWKEGKDEQIRDDVGLLNKRTGEVFSDKMSMTFLKIPLMDKDPEACRDSLDRWLYMLKHMDKMKAIPNTFTKDPVFKRLGEVAKVRALNDDERRAYEASLKVYRDNYAIALTEREEGIKEGIGQGENIMLRKNVSSLRSKGFTDEDIADMLDQSLSTISNL